MNLTFLDEVDHLKANMATLSAAKIVYSAGFFITVSPESMEVASNEMLKTGGTYCMNLWLGSARRSRFIV